MTFSVVIPCFNQGPFLEECLDSLAAQTCPPDEVIVVDDGSTDAWTIARIDELCVGRIRKLRQPNRGPSAARNAGIDASHGDWVLPLDADDQLAPDALAIYSEAIRQDPSVAVWYPDLQLFGLQSAVAEVAEFDPWRLLWANFMVYSAAIRRDVFEAVRYDERLPAYEDWAFYIAACVERRVPTRRLPRTLLRYRRWGYSLIAYADARREELTAEVRRLRPIYADAPRLDELKRTHGPFFAIAARTNRAAASLESQSFRDFRVIDATDRVLRDQSLAAFQGSEGTHLLIILDEDALVAALEADRTFLEKLALRLSARDPEVSFVGSTLRLAVVAPLSMFLQHRSIDRTSDGLVEDLAHHWASDDLPVGLGPQWPGPVGPEVNIASFLRLRAIIADPPRFTSQSGPAILAAADARLRQVLEPVAPNRVLEISASGSSEAHVFSLAEMGGRNPGRVLAELVERHDVRALVLAGGQELYALLPSLQKLQRRPRVFARIDAAGPGSAAEAVASQLNNLIDTYVVAESRIAEALFKRCYVSPSKLVLGGEERLAQLVAEALQAPG